MARFSLNYVQLIVAVLSVSSVVISNALGVYDEKDKDKIADHQMADFDNGDGVDVVDKVNLDSNSGPVSLGFFHAFVASLSVIIVSELGDKTFFIAAIMAMRHARLTVFSAALLALAVMTVLSAALGFATTVIPRWFTYYASTFLFAIFGLRMLREGWNMSPDEGQEELEEVQAELKKRDEEFLAPAALFMCNCFGGKHRSVEREPKQIDSIESDHSHFNGGNNSEVVKLHHKVANGQCNGGSHLDYKENELMERETMSTVTQDAESGVVRGGKPKKVFGLLSPIFVQAFILTFLAEWGDRSQITTIILAARENVFGVTIGGVLGHAFCTGLAVLGGRLVAQRISVRTVTLIGGVVFLIFALSALFLNSEEESS